ncbi:hypothetical protein K490DRAFT_68641 [Saccharata proteae CBS 121410]|uniref:Flavin reductase like domain-containing protein n=1 Tax=Saccharata proteae CBS 121410 TaxID=1314787 RepID=A0A9P4HPZ4_9PEZI|nr:hypothetical protein K490DRAFT_68641 [Saccharata proteae CBS 121410]
MVPIPDPEKTIPLVKTMMRRVPHPVAIITASAYTGQPGTESTCTTSEPGGTTTNYSDGEGPEPPQEVSTSSPSTLQDTIKRITPASPQSRKNGTKILSNPLHRAKLLSQYRGITVSSFNTVTLSPRPTISFNIKRPSRTLDAIHTTGLLRVHILSQAEVSGEMAMIFARNRPQEEAWEEMYNLSKKQPRGVVRVQHMFPGEQAPALVGRAVLASLPCRVLREKCVEVGDHVIVVAEPYAEPVMPSLSPTGNDRDVESPVKSGLLYLNGHFRKHLQKPETQGDAVTDYKTKHMVREAVRRIAAKTRGVSGRSLMMEVERTLWPQAMWRDKLAGKKTSRWRRRRIRVVPSKLEIKKHDATPVVRDVRTDVPHDEDITALFGGEDGGGSDDMDAEGKIGREDEEVGKDDEEGNAFDRAEIGSGDRMKKWRVARKITEGRRRSGSRWG